MSTHSDYCKTPDNHKCIGIASYGTIPTSKQAKEYKKHLISKYPRTNKIMRIRGSFFMFEAVNSYNYPSEGA